MEFKLVLFLTVFMFTVHVVCDEAKPSKKCTPCKCFNNTADCSNKALQYVPTLPDNIIIVILNNNKLQNLNASVLAPIAKLNITNLQIRQNHLVYISEDAFSAFSHLQSLDLGNNLHLDKASLAASLGKVSKLLQHLSLDSIGLSTTSNLLAGMVGSNMVSINLSSNYIKYLNLSAFQHLQNLTKLNVMKNWIKDVQSENFTLPILQNLNLANNEIARFPPYFCTRHTKDKPLYPRLMNIDLSNNFINVLYPETWNCLDRLGKLSLDGNVISHFTKNAFSKLPFLTTLQLSNMAGRVKYIDGLAFNNSRLEKLNLYNNDIHFSQLENVSIFNYTPNLQALNLNKNNFGKIPDVKIKNILAPLVNLAKLDLSNSKLSSIPSGLFSTMKNLTSLFLDGNALRNLDGAFINISTLTHLSIQDNWINIPTKESFPDELMSNLKNINLADNPFQCTCELLWFKTFIGNSGQVGHVKLDNWPQRYNCRTPPNMYKTRLQHYNPTEKSCAEDRTLLYALVSCAVLFILAITTVILVYNNIWYIRYWRYKLKRTRPSDPESQPLLEQISYDAYVIYADEDERFVFGCLRQLLEEKLNYKLFLWDRDSELGIQKVDAMADGIYASRAVLAVVSDSFLKNDWCKFQLDVSVNKQIEDKKELLTLLIKEGLNYDKLNKSWCVLLTKLKTAKWCDDESKIQGKLFREEIKQRLG